MRGKSFKVPLSKYIATSPSTLESEVAERLCQRLCQKHSRLAKNALIRAHLRLGAKLVSSYAMRYPYLIDDLLSEMLVAVVDGVNKIENGAIAHHNGHPNPGAYLNVTITGVLNKFTYRQQTVHISKETLDKLEGNGPKKVHFHDKYVKDLRLQKFEVDDLINFACHNAMERNIITLRMEGHTDEEIGKQINRTKERVRQIRVVLQGRLKKYCH